VLYGGSFNNDTWEWDGNNWERRLPTVTPTAWQNGRSHPGMAFDVSRTRTVLFGGHDGGSWGDTWEWDGSNWTPRGTAVSPEKRNEMAMTYDAGRSRVVMYGGAESSGGSGQLGDIWEYFVPCDVVRQGHPGGGLSIGCGAVPRIGAPLSISFLTPPGPTFLSLGMAPCNSFPLPISPPLACTSGFLHTSLTVILGSTGGSYVLPIPNQPSLVGVSLCFQGGALSGCILATDALVATIQP